MLPVAEGYDKYWSEKKRLFWKKIYGEPGTEEIETAVLYMGMSVTIAL